MPFSLPHANPMEQSPNQLPQKLPILKYPRQREIEILSGVIYIHQPTLSGNVKCPRYRRRRCRTASSSLYAGEMAISRYSSPVITCRQRLLKPFKIRDTAFVSFDASHEWVNVEHTHSLSFMLRDRRWSTKTLHYLHGLTSSIRTA